MVKYIAAYDTEIATGHSYGSDVPSCLEACRAIVKRHHEHQMPATFFLVGEALLKSRSEFRDLLDNPLFEVASHTWSHVLLQDHPFGTKAVPHAQALEEIRRSKEAVEDVFGRPCIGFRPAYAFVDGFRGNRPLLEAIVDAGYRYTASVAWGQDYSLPAPVAEPFTYESDGFPGLIEFPACGWHENLLKGNNRIQGMGPLRLALFPPPFPDAMPPGLITTVEEEFRYNNKVFIDRAVQQNATHVSLVWHPWSLGMFDPAMDMLDRTFGYVRELGMEATTFGEMARNSVNV